MKQADHDALRTAVGLFVSVDTSMLELVTPQVVRMAKGEHLLMAGQPAKLVVLVVEGVLREYFPLADGRERTKAFIVENQFSGSLVDLLSGKPSAASIVAEEPVRALTFEFSEMTRLVDAHASWLEFRRRATEALLARKAEREYELLALDAEARYAAFARTYPGIEARVAAKHIASYLGITPVHLSRLRRRRVSQAMSTKPATNDA